jgi:hypothetical protein
VACKTLQEKGIFFVCFITLFLFGLLAFSTFFNKRSLIGQIIERGLFWNNVNILYFARVVGMCIIDIVEHFLGQIGPGRGASYAHLK